jgi:hypothetical protein
MKVHVQGLANSTDAETLAEQVLDLKRSKADIEHQLVSQNIIVHEKDHLKGCWVHPEQLQGAR